MIDKILTYQELYDEYLTSKGSNVNSASASLKSEANSYAKCYEWYIEKMKVLPENATLASRIWVDKYALHTQTGECCEQTPAEMWDRISIVLANEEMKSPSNTKEFSYWKDRFYGVLDGWKYSPQGSGLFALGNPYVKASSSNCFTLPPPEDNLESIFDTAKNMARIFAFRGGEGHDISNLRPRGAATNNAARSSTGAASFMDFFSYVTGMIGQSGRRGANLQTMRISHPDIELFIEEKSDMRKQPFFEELAGVGININDYKWAAIADRLKSTSHSNVSVRINDKFMKAVKEDGEYELWFEFKDNAYPRISRMIQARVLWDKLMHHAWSSAEPGILNWDHIIRESPADQYTNLPEIEFTDPATGETKWVSYSFETVGLNPCLTGDTWILTDDGAKQIKDLIGIPHLTILNGKQFPATGFWSTGVKPVFKISTSRGHSIKATANHKFLVKGADGIVEWVELQNLQPKAELVLSQNLQFGWGGGGTLEEGYLVGSFLGDGHYHTSTKSAVLGFWGEGKQTAQKAISFIKDLPPLSKKSPIPFGSDINLEPEGDRIYIKSKQLFILCSQYLEFPSKRPLDSIEYASSDFVSGFLSGLFDADGTILVNPEKGNSIRLNQSDTQILYLAQRLLARLGINSSVYENRRDAEFREMPLNNGTGENKSYWCKANHELVISRRSIITFSERVGFLQTSKIEKLALIVAPHKRSPYKDCITTKVISIEPAGEEEVFDCTVEGPHAFDANGLVSHNCAEETLSAFDSCNLGLFLLPAFVKNPYTPEASFDFEAYGEVIAMGVRAQDNIKSWDLPILPLEGNRIAGVLGRRISVGNTGLADALAMLGLRYDTDEAIQMAESIYDFLANAAYQTSARLAEEKGSFQIFDWERHKKSPFIQRLSKETQKLIRTKGLRNIGLLTQSPAGSLSIEMRNCTSGIEPLFLAAMSRSVKVPGSGDTVQYIVYHQGIQDALNINPDFDKSIYVEANSIDYHKRIKMQAAIQRHIDHSISSTVNLPNDATVEDVSQLYMEAFDSGLKGITVYRDGCRTGVLNSIKKEVAEPVVRRERPKTTDIKIHKVKYRNLNYMVLVGLADGKPIEVFGGLEDGLSLPTKYQSATLTKKSRGHYSLVVQLSDDPEDVLKVNNVSARFPAEDIMTITRLISLSMRNGVPVSEITDQLQKSAGGMFDAPAIFARVLKNYLEDEDLVRMAASKTCPQCGGDIEIRRESGCLTETCRNTKCGWVNSKCS